MSAIGKFSFFLTVLTTLTSHQAFNFDPVNQDLGAFVVKIRDAYISHSRWRLLYHYDLKDFYDNIKLYKESLDKLEEICNKLDESDESSQCITLMKKHRTSLEDMNVDMEYLEIIQRETSKNVQKRKRRNAPFGYLATYAFKPLFGVMDEEDAELVTNKINELVTVASAKITPNAI